MDSARLIARLRRGNLANVAFRDFTRLLVDLGFELRRTSGSHHIYGHPRMAELVNVQDLNGQAKAYQVRQAMRLVQQYNLSLEDGR